jgi:hypothetical protein
MTAATAVMTAPAASREHIVHAPTTGGTANTFTNTTAYTLPHAHFPFFLHDENND